MKVQVETLLLFVLATTFGSAGTLVWLGHISVSLDELSQALLNVVAAFSGAWFAFRLQEEKDSSSKESDEIDAIRRTQLALITQANKLQNVSRDILESVRDDSGRWLTMRPNQDIDPGHLRVEVQRLHFLLQDDADLLLKIHVTEEAYISVVDALNARSRMHIHEIQPVLERILAIPNAPRDPAGLEVHLGDRLVVTMKHATDSCYSSYDNALKKNEHVQDLLGRVARKRHPGKKFLVMKRDA